MTGKPIKDGKLKDNQRVTVWIDKDVLRNARGQGILQNIKLSMLVESLLIEYNKGLIKTAVSASDVLTDRVTAGAENLTIK